MKHFFKKYSVGIVVIVSVFCIAAGTYLIGNGKLTTNLDANNMALVNVLNQAPKEIWISVDRTDGKGHGTQLDPFDGHTQPLLDAILATAKASSSHVHLMAGTFFTLGQNLAVTSNVGNGEWIEGSGVGSTIVQIVGSQAGYHSYTTAFGGNVNNTKISGMTIDCNWAVIGLTADDGATCVDNGVTRSKSDGVLNSGSPTVTSATMAFTVNDIGRIISATGIPANTFIGVVTNATTIGLSSSPVANVPVNATASASGVTLTLKEKNVTSAAIGIRGSENLIDNILVINSYGSQANNLEQFAITIGAPQGGPDAVNNVVSNCRVESPWGSYGSPYAIFGWAPYIIRHTKLTNCYGVGVNNGSWNMGFTSGGVNIANAVDVVLSNNHWIDCGFSAYHDTSLLDGLSMVNETGVRLANGVAVNANSLSSTVTITIASPGVVTWANHGRYNGEAMTFSTTGALPTGLAVTTTYYIINSTTNTFQVAATPSGAAITTSGSQSGIQTCNVIMQQNIVARDCNINIQNRAVGGGVGFFLSTSGVSDQVSQTSNKYTVSSGGLGAASIYPFFTNTISNSLVALNVIDAGYTSSIGGGAKIFHNYTPAGAAPSGLTDN